MENYPKNERKLRLRPSGWKALIPIICTLLLWHTASSFSWVNSYLLPPPEKVIKVLKTMIVTGQIWQHLFSSLLRVIFGFLIAFVLAMILAIGHVWGSGIAFLYDEPLKIIRMIPPLSLIPLMILWFGLGEASKLILITLSAFFPMYINAKAGMERGMEKYADLIKIFQFSPAKKMLSIILPSAVPNIISGVRIGFGYSWRALVGAEMLAATCGLGYFILDAQAMARTDKVLAGIIIISSIGALSDEALKRVISILIPPNMRYE